MGGVVWFLLTQWNITELLHCRTDLHRLQWSQQDVSPELLLPDLAPEVVQNHDMVCHRHGGMLYNYHRWAASVWVSADPSLLGPIRVRYR